MEKYLNKKYIESILYNTTLNQTQNKLDIDFLKKLSQYLKMEENQNIIPENIKQKIYRMMEYIRFTMDKNKNAEYNDQLNNIIILTNNCTDKDCTRFYYDQLRVRTLEDEKRIFKTGIDDETKKRIYRSISYDYIVLKDITKPSRQYEENIREYIGNELFLHSIKGMYYENPYIFEKLRVQINILKTLMENDKLILQNESKIESKILNRYNQKIKELVIKR